MKKYLNCNLHRSLLSIVNKKFLNFPTCILIDRINKCRNLLIYINRNYLLNNFCNCLRRLVYNLLYTVNNYLYHPGNQHSFPYYIIRNNLLLFYILICTSYKQKGRVNYILRNLKQDTHNRFLSTNRTRILKNIRHIRLFFYHINCNTLHHTPRKHILQPT